MDGAANWLTKLCRIKAPVDAPLPLGLPACLPTERIVGLLIRISGNCNSDCAYAHGFPVLSKAFMWSYLGLVLEMAGCLIGAGRSMVGWFVWGLKPREARDFATWVAM
jgi:hypothetical protein